MKNAKFFVAGHAGLIGSALLRALEREGCREIVTRTRSELDLRDAAKVTAFFEAVRPEYVLLAAGRVGGIIENRDFPADFLNENLAIQLNVLKAAHAAGVSKLILFASSCMYPRECPQPMAEEVLLSGRPEPTSLPYAISKLVGMQMCLAYNKQYGGERFIPVIPNSAYGQNDNFNPASAHVLSSLLARFHDAKVRSLDSVALWGSGAPLREFVHADDIADACLHLLRHDVAASALPFNIGSGVEISIKALAETIAGVVGYEGRLEWDSSKPDGAPRKFLDSARLRASGWRPKISFETGLRNTYEWYVKNIDKA